jgi:hypothetical protein
MLVSRPGMPNGWRVVGRGSWLQIGSFSYFGWGFFKMGGTFGGNKASRKQTNLFAAVQEKMP